MPLFSLPRKLTEPHKEWNDDGTESIHAGYAVAECRLCKDAYIVARTAYLKGFDTCSNCEDKGAKV